MNKFLGAIVGMSLSCKITWVIVIKYLCEIGRC